MSEATTKSILRTANNQLLLREVLQELHQQERLRLEELIRIYQGIQGDVNVPLSIFAGKLKPAEALCLFLKERIGLSHRQIAEALNRDPRSIWGTFNRTKKKSKRTGAREDFPEKISQKYFLPLQIFQDRSLSLLEHATYYLHQVCGLTNKQIGALLQRSPNSIAVLYKRAREKKK